MNMDPCAVYRTLGRSPVLAASSPNGISSCFRDLELLTHTTGVFTTLSLQQDVNKEVPLQCEHGNEKEVHAGRFKKLYFATRK